jgi:hypothetical protein
VKLSKAPTFSLTPKGNDMTAIPRRYFQRIEQSIAQLKTRLNDLYNISFTHDEFLQLFAAEEDHRILKEAARVAWVNSVGGVHATEFNSHKFTEAWGSNTVHLNFHVNMVDNFAPLIPRNSVILQDAPSALIGKLTRWVLARVEQNFEMSTVNTLLWWMQNNCDNPAQIRFLWPSILSLASMHEETKDWGDRLREIRKPKTLPPLNLAVREACRSTAGIIASAGMLTDDNVLITGEAVTCDITSVSASKMIEGLGKIYGA